ncbi:MAG TPA: zinc ribbon domain-containing protein [Trebonia sp.]
MNCPQCQTANGSGSAFCGNCGAQMTVAQAAGSAGYPPPQGSGAPLGYAASGAPTGYDAPQGYNAAGGYDPEATQQSAGYPQGQYQPPAGGGRQAPRPSSLPPVNFDHNRLTKVDKIVAGGTFITMISIWLPWFSISWGSSTFQDAGSASISGTTGHGWLWLEFIVALALLAYLAARAAWDRLPFTMPIAHAPLLIAGTALQLLLVLIAFIDIPYGSDGVGWAWGAFIALLAALAAAGPVVVPAVRSYLDSRKAAGGTRY